MFKIYAKLPPSAKKFFSERAEAIFNTVYY